MNTTATSSTYFSYTQIALRRFETPTGIPESILNKTCRIALAIVVLLGSVFVDLVLAPLNWLNSLCHPSSGRSIPEAPIFTSLATPPARTIPLSTSSQLAFTSPATPPARTIPLSTPSQPAFTSLATPPARTIPLSTPSQPAPRSTSSGSLAQLLERKRIIDRLTAAYPTGQIPIATTFIKDTIIRALPYCHAVQTDGIVLHMLHTAGVIEDTLSTEIDIFQWIGACLLIEYFLHRINYHFPDPDNSTDHETDNRNSYPPILEKHRQEIEPIFLAFKSLTLSEQATVVEAIRAAGAPPKKLSIPHQNVVNQIRGRGLLLWRGPYNPNERNDIRNIYEDMYKNKIF